MESIVNFKAMGIDRWMERMAKNMEGGPEWYTIRLL